MASFRRISSLAAVIFVAGVSAAAQHAPMPPGMTHEEHLTQMKKEAELKAQGGAAMGFDQERATHHFTLAADGGVIAVGANDSADVTTRDQIRAHLREIAKAFADGNFAKPLMTHGEPPPGAAGMERLKAHITYAFEQTANGGAVRIRTSDADALSAIHEFLRYQIREHQTGDPVDTPK